MLGAFKSDDDAACSARAQVALRSEALFQAFVWNCRTKAALQNYFLSFCMELLFRTCSAKLFLELSHGSVVQKLPFEAVFKLLFGTVEQQLTCKATPQGVMSLSISRMLRCALK